ncbi:MAG: hypothetical protein V3T88_07570 [Nitrosomonadaceae bacterium]
MTLLHDENEHGRKALRVTALLAHFPTQEQTAAVGQMIVEDYLSAIEDIPAYAVDLGVRSMLLSGLKRKPNIAQLRESCILKARHYTELKGYVKKLIEHWGE